MRLNAARFLSSMLRCDVSSMFRRALERGAVAAASAATAAAIAMHAASQVGWCRLTLTLNHKP
jgi:hypothetical protein